MFLATRGCLTIKTFAFPAQAVNTRNLRSTCDTRKLTQLEQIGLRKRAFAMQESLAFAPLKIAQSLCVASRTVYRWLAAKTNNLADFLVTYVVG